MQCADETRTALYRFYDSRQELLYVGITIEPWRRWREHVLTQPWYPRAKHWTVTWHDSEAEALDAERRAIRGERPRFNIAGAPEPAPVRFAVHVEPVLVACVVWWCLPMALTVLIVAVAHWHWLVMATVVITLGMPVSWVVVALVCFAPQVRRFGAWLDRHVVWDAGEAAGGKERAGKVLALAREQR